MAFHSPIMRVIHDELATFVASIPVHPPQIPVISNTTMAPYPSDPDEIRRILMSHLESPVHWMDNVQTLWNDFGVRLFTEVGPGEALSNLILDTLPEPACIQTCHPSSESLSFRTALARLYVHGHLKVEGEPRFVSLSALGPSLESLPIAPSAAVRPSEERGSGVSEGQKQLAPVKPATAPHDPATARMGQTPPVSGETSDGQDVMERLIRIIMDATGFERDEIQPDMDLKRDLSIRSSRLPIIMDAAERQFGITIEMEDFIDVRTVMDIARRISRLVAVQGACRSRSRTLLLMTTPRRERDRHLLPAMRRLRVTISWRVLFRSSWMQPDSKGMRFSPTWNSKGISPSGPAVSRSSWMLRNAGSGSRSKWRIL